MADALDSKSSARKGVSVQVRPPVLRRRRGENAKEQWAELNERVASLIEQMQELVKVVAGINERLAAVERRIEETADAAAGE